MTSLENLRTVKQLSRESPAFTEGSLRWLIFNANENGLSEVMVRVGGRVLIDIDHFNEWLEERRGGQRPHPEET